MYCKRGFTLIELLIVVAIIGILAAIAIPNFLSAQTRSKVARMQAAIQTAATALESYHVDNNNYPYYNNPIDTDDHHLPLFLTTPVSYLSSLPVDIFFPEEGEPLPPQGNVIPFHYATEDFSTGEVQEKAEVAGVQNASIKWILWSIGPDHREDDGELFYDPTNGTISNGDLMRFGP